MVAEPGRSDYFMERKSYEIPACRAPQYQIVGFRWVRESRWEDWINPPVARTSSTDLGSPIDV